MQGLARLGFGFIEIGTLTPHPQAGNNRPRLFRLFPDRALINRMGFNNGGMEEAAERLQGERDFLLGVNIGKNKESLDPIADYRKAAKCLSPLADYLTVNISSPNTPGLRLLQARENLLPLLEALQPHRAKRPLLVKVAPDLIEEDAKAIAALALDGLCDGLIIGNTTIRRPDNLRSPYKNEAGGLSGRPLFSLSTRLLSDFYRMTEGRVPLIGVGGIEDGKTAYGKIKAGASLLQLYTALIYGGPFLVPKILKDLAFLLQRDGYSHIAQAIGADHR